MKRNKDDLIGQYNRAKIAGKYMVAVWSVEGDKLNLYRLTKDFPFVDIPAALDLLKKDLDPINMKAKGPDVVG